MEPGSPDPISDIEVRLTAQLSELQLSPDELPRLTEALKTMLGHFEVVSRIVSEEGKLTSPVENRCWLGDCRSDDPRTEPFPAETRQILVNAAPDYDDEYFFVPRIK